MSELPVQDIFDALHEAGMSVALAPGDALAISPGSRLTPDLRELIWTNKAALVDWLHAANNPTAVTHRPKEMFDPDRWCWPYSSAMTGREIHIMVERTNLFNQRGLTALDAERLAYALVVRDRDFDDRHLCLECSHLTTGRVMRCLEWQRAGLGHPSVPDSLPTQLQRCEGFSEPK